MQEILTKVSGEEIYQTHQINFCQEKLQPAETEKLYSYKRLLLKWNSKINLISPKTEASVWQRHIINSALFLEVFQNIGTKHIIDIGSGGGLPAIILAILLPQKNFYLIEKTSKKSVFLQMLKSELCLNNIHIHNQKANADFLKNLLAIIAMKTLKTKSINNSHNHIESDNTGETIKASSNDYNRDDGGNIVLSARAFASVKDTLQLTKSVAGKVTYLLQKGLSYKQELQEAQQIIRITNKQLKVKIYQSITQPQSFLLKI